MHRLIGVFVTACLLAFPAAAQLLSYEEVLENISGSWAYPLYEDGDSAADVVRDCSLARINISIQYRGGERYYVAEYIGPVRYDAYVHEQIVAQATDSKGNGLPALFIKYDPEPRLDDNGNPISWRLFMIDKDTFTWSATHWKIGETLPRRTRCEADANIS